MPQSSRLHRRYLDKLGKQEDEVEKYRADVKMLQGQEHARRRALDDFLAAARFRGGEPARPWWAYTAERKRALQARGKEPQTV